MSKLLILSDEFLARLHVGLGELQAKFAIPVISEIQKQVDLFEKDAATFIADVEAHIAPLRAKIAPAPSAEILAASPVVETAA